MKIAFLMDRLDTIEPTNETTIHLMHECNQRGHTVYFLEPHDVYIRSDKIVARMRNVTVKHSLSIIIYWQEMLKCLERDELLFEKVSDLDALFLRKDPPLNYQVMEFLGPISEQVFIINSCTGQILGNSKLYTLNFPGIIPETHVSRDPKRLKKIIENFGGDMVIKPLQRYGGEGIIKVSNRDQENLASLIDYYVKACYVYPEREPIMVQEYINGVVEYGDIRILLLNGEILGAMRRKPAPGSFRTNIHAGGMAFKHKVTVREKRICNTIKDRLIKDGLFFVGIDLIEDKLIEVNCVSPGGIPRINRLNNQRIEVKVIDFIEKKVKKM